MIHARGEEAAVVTEVARVAVVVTAHNRAGLLDRALTSVRAQTVRDLRIVVVDDASSDATPQVCARHAAEDARVEVVRLDTNVGVAEARNTGIDRSESSYVAFMDADDLAEPTWIEHLLEAAEREGVDLVKAGHLLDVPVGSRRTFTVPSRPVEEAVVLPQDGVRVRPKELMYAIGFAWNSLYARSAIEGVRFDRSLPLFEDMVFNLDVMARLPRVAFVPATDYHYVQHTAHRLTNRPQVPDLPFRGWFGRRLADQLERLGVAEATRPELVGLIGWSLSVVSARKAPPGVDPVAEIRGQLDHPDVRWLLEVAQGEHVRRADRPVVEALRAGNVRRARRTAQAIERLAHVKARAGLRVATLRG
jgi:hypothetical protein